MSAIDLRPTTTDHRALRHAYGRFPSGVTAVCGIVEAQPVGFTASAFAPVSLEPPLVSVCVLTPSWTWNRLRSAPRIGVSVLGEDHDEVARKLAAKTHDRFSGVQWQVADKGAVFIERAAAWLECSLESEIRAGDHLIVLLRVRRLTTDPGVSPLVFHGSTFRKLA